MSDDAVILDADADGLLVNGPDDVIDAVAATLGADKAALEVVVDIFGPVQVVAAGTDFLWPPRGGWVPAWQQRRLRPREPLFVLPSESVPPRVYPPPAPIPDDWRLVCAVCGGKGRCRSDHTDRLRAHAVRLLKQTKSEKRRQQIEAALAALP